MNQIEKEFKKYGYMYTQVKREGKICVYSQHNIDEETKEVGRLMAYEVFEVQEMKEGYAGPTKKYFLPAREVPPGSNSWGEKAFTCHTLEQAEVKFQELVKRNNNPDVKKSKSNKRKVQ